MDELVGPERMRDLEPHRRAATVDEHAAAASQPQLCVVVIDMLGPGRRAPDHRLDQVRRRPAVDGNQQLGRPLEALEPDAIRADRVRLQNSTSGQVVVMATSHILRGPSQGR